MHRFFLFGWPVLTSLGFLVVAVAALCHNESQAQEPVASCPSLQISQAPPPVAVTVPEAAPCDKPLPINLPTALRLAQVQPLDIALASQRIRVAAAQLERADVLWLPTLYVGGDYSRHDGRVQDVAGNIADTSKQSLMFGAGPSAVFAIADAIFEPLAQRQNVQARQASLQTAYNDTLLAVAEAYFNVQQARGQLAAAEDVVHRTEDLVGRTAKLVGLVPALEVVRVRTVLSRSRIEVTAARERWRLASAELARLLRLEPTALFQPLEPPHLQVTLIPIDRPVDDLIPIALSYRPELATQQALVQATLLRLRQERMRPLIPSVLIRGFSTPVTGTLAAGVFGGGLNNSMNNFGARGDWDLQLLWEFKSLGLGNLALMKERRAENQLALLELFRTEDLVAREVVQAHAQGQSAAMRLTEATAGLKDAVDSVEKNLEGLKPRRQGDVWKFTVRPQEAVAAVQVLAQAYNDYYTAVADYDRAQFRLYRALGHPAQALAADEPGCTSPPPEGPMPAPALPPESGAMLGEPHG
jgi:outer membrane protein TolC